MDRLWIATAIITASVALVSTAAAENTACQTAAVKAEKKFGLPEGLLQAIAIVESGKSVNNQKTAWPWTVNVAGKGHYFKTRSEAQTFVAQKLAANISSIDIGCFQINTRWHGDAFDSAKAMFDPNTSAEYAAQFLSALKEEMGDWLTATKYYHSRTEKRGAAYASRVYNAVDDIKATSNKTTTTPLIVKPEPSSPGFGGVKLQFFHMLAPIIDAKPLPPILQEEE